MLDTSKRTAKVTEAYALEREPEREPSLLYPILLANKSLRSNAVSPDL